MIAIVNIAIIIPIYKPCIFLILLLTGLGTSLFYLYKQKFLVETQNDFIRNVTHEFQTPLATLSLGLDALAKSSIYEHPEKLERYRNQ